MSANGHATSFWSVGDTKTFQLSQSGEVTAQPITVEIVGFNHDDLTSGGKAGITFGMTNLMDVVRMMNSDATDSASFLETELYNQYFSSIFQAMPQDLKDAIKPVNKLSNKGYPNGLDTPRSDSIKIWLFSYNEIFGENPYDGGANGEGQRYQRFTSAEQMMGRRLANGAGEVSSWWLRSPNTERHEMYFWIVLGAQSMGYTSFSLANIARGVCFGFCV